MHGRLQRTGRFRELDRGAGDVKVVECYNILSADLRETLTSVWGVAEAVTVLESIVKQERLACPTGGCED